MPGIVPYFGEFLINPSPLELSLNWCSYQCPYCFANLNKPQRKADVKKITSQLQHLNCTVNKNGKERYKNNSIEAKLLRAKYPLVLSNHVDPFAKSNVSLIKPILRLLDINEIPINWQTKGTNLDTLAEHVNGRKPEVWYVSISFDSDKKRKRIEPHAPPIELRLKVVQWLVRNSHRVVVGINPFLSDWIEDLPNFLARLKEMGVHGVWLQHLHLNYKQRNNLKKPWQEAIEPWQEMAMKQKTPFQWQDDIAVAFDIADQINLPYFTVGQSFPSDFFLPWYECYENTFPTMQEFVNLLWNTSDGSEKIQLFNFEDWASFFLSRLPKIYGSSMKNYILSTTQDVQVPVQLPSKIGFKGLLRAMWHPDIRMGNPIKHQAFSYALYKEELVLDEYDLPLMAFSPYGFDSEDVDCTKIIEDKLTVAI